MAKVRVVCSILAAILLTGCASLPHATSDTVEGRVVEYATAGQGAPVVVFENGLGSDMSAWNAVFSDIGRDFTVFAYNRPGYGQSADTDTARDGGTVARELHALLARKGLRPPYILVGHSLGGLYTQVFARTYPADVAGMVLVDSSHPGQFEGPGAAENWPFLARALTVVLSGAQERELEAAPRTGQQLLALPPPSGVPVVILSARDESSSEHARFFNEKRADLARLYPGSRQLWVGDSHFIQTDSPKAVIDAIRSIAAGWRGANGT